MFAKVAVMIVLLASSSSAHAVRQVDCPSLQGGSDLSNVTRALYLQRTPDTWEKPCVDEECRASFEIFCAADAYSHRLLPNTMSYHSPEEAQHYFQLHGRNMQALGQEHPGRIPLYCKLLARVAATITGESEVPRSEGGRDWTAYYLSDFAVRLDRPGNHCLADVLAAVPKRELAQSSMDWLKPCLHHMARCQKDLDPPLR